MEFGAQVESAYEHLYDLVYLRTHPLAELLLPDPTLSRKERAWQLHRILLEVIDELDPGPQAATFSREWRRHRLMVLRYVDGLDPQSVADQVAIGRRHYYREQEVAIEAIARILWDRYMERRSSATRRSQLDQGEASPNRPELLRLEAARTSQAERQADVPQVVAGVLPLLQERLDTRRLAIELALPEALPRVSVERSLLRQLLLAMLGYLIERAEQATIRVTVQSAATGLRLSLAVEPPVAIQPSPEAEVGERLSAFEELAALGGARLLPVGALQPVVGLQVELPVSSEGTVLVVDDNEDVLELFRRYLGRYHQVVCARTAREALDLAVRLRPRAITLDLMMPEQDGWDLLHLLLGQPDTRNIPLIVCSVLRQKELALSLGATAFLEKPVSEEALLSVLHLLQGT